MAPPALWLAAASCAAATAVELSNTALPRDTAGRPLVTGMVDVLDNSARDGYWYIVNDDWGCVEQVDCCARGPEPACWKCCEAMRPAAYAGNHTIVGYRTRDFVAFESLGTLLAPAQRSAGNEYRPHLVHNARTGLYLLWFGNWNMTTIPKPGDKVVGMYSIAGSASPAGPYRVIRDGPSHQVDFKCSGSQGDFDLLVDDDGRAYLVNTFYSHFCLEELDANYTAGTGVTAVVESADFLAALYYLNGGGDLAGLGAPSQAPGQPGAELVGAQVGAGAAAGTDAAGATDRPLVGARAAAQARVEAQAEARAKRAEARAEAKAKAGAAASEANGKA